MNIIIFIIVDCTISINLDVDGEKIRRKTPYLRDGIIDQIDIKQNNKRICISSKKYKCYVYYRDPLFSLKIFHNKE